MTRRQMTDPRTVLARHYASRLRLRPAHPPEKLREIYATPHDHTRFPDHKLRVDATIALARWMAGDGVNVAADLSCGDGAVLKAIPANRRIFGDFAPGYEFTGPIEETVERIGRVDLFTCCETLEHVDDPDAVLAKIRAKTQGLVLSTPVGAWDDDNEEHYWAWSRSGVEEMLTAAGFRLGLYVTVDFTPMGLPYNFGIWGVR